MTPLKSTFLAGLLLTVSAIFHVSYHQLAVTVNTHSSNTHAKTGVPGLNTGPDKESFHPFTTQSQVPTFSAPPPVSKIINPHDFQFVETPTNLCREDKQVELVICVPIARNNFEKRRVISQTWGSYAHEHGNKAILLFFIGNGSISEPPDVELRIRNESRQYTNIVQEDYIDSYQNLSLKSVSILRWVSVYCPQAKFVIKADDDVYVNIPNLVPFLRQTHEKYSTAFVAGYVIEGAVPVQNKKSKWYTPKSAFPEKVYPRYVSGTFYFMSGVTAKLLYQSSQLTPLFWLEDVYITGICSRKAGVPVVNHPKQTIGKPEPEGCVFRKMVAGHRYSTTEMKKIHQQVYNTSYTCPEK